MTRSDPEGMYLEEVDADQVPQLAADDPNLATRTAGTGPVDHEANIGDIVDDDPVEAATDAAAATIDDDDDLNTLDL